MILKAKLLVHGVNQIHDAHDLVGELVGTHEQVRIVLVEAANAEQAMQSTAQLMTMDKANLARTNGQLAIRVRLSSVHKHATRAVHGLDAVLLVIDEGGVHVVLVVIPVTGGLPKLLVHDKRRGNLDVAGIVMDLAPVIEQGILKDHAVGQEEREARCLVAHHEEVHLGADLTMVALLGLLEQAHVLVKLLLGGKGNAVHAREHLVVLVVFPIGTGNAGELEGLERLGIADVGTDAHVDVLALLVEGDASVLIEVADVLDLILLAALLHKGDSLGAGQLVHAKLEVLLHDLFHLVLDGGEIVLGDLLAIGQIDIVVEAVVGSRTIGKIGLGIEALDSLGHDMGSRVTNNVRYFVLGQLGHRSIVIEGLHTIVPSVSSNRSRYASDDYTSARRSVLERRANTGALIQPASGACAIECEFGSRGTPSSGHRGDDGSWGRRCAPGCCTRDTPQSPSRWGCRTWGSCRTGQAGARAAPYRVLAPRGLQYKSWDAAPNKR